MPQLAESLSRLCDAAPYERSDILDECLWLMATAPGSDLKDIAGRIWHKPLVSLPPAISVLLLRLAANENRDDREFVESAIASIVSFCDPFEEKDAVASLKHSSK